ncbi:uncharacterized oxidoreductase [[Candida] jaroonii]|uniref:Uncharacterized oxidoreductase n=1 Tax=[Candida] jaroonii TaxID=467808 RepID=A0ACA9Y6L3_9ASCO|nr:uncharacterized oxidoreductase [[Candida] jaroonii]
MTTYLITGANRGIGLSLVKEALKDSNNTVVATVRDKSKTSELSTISNKNLHIIELDTSQTLEEIKASFSVLDSIVPNGVDTVVQNAGIAEGEDLQLKVFSKHVEKIFHVNFLGSVKVYEALEPYWLSKDNGVQKKFFFISSIFGSITYPLPLRPVGYGGSKAAINYFVSSVALFGSKSTNELFKNSVVSAIHPGLVTTDMGGPVTRMPEFQGIPSLTPEESAALLVSTFSKSDQSVNGKFIGPEGELLPI